MSDPSTVLIGVRTRWSMCLRMPASLLIGGLEITAEAAGV